ncbi:MAG: nucleotidyltransferase family protein [Coriobacteriales bacterium]|jgi:CTP:molybdopterin cytidylyltransferase MocA|nr:nucleotidyltransferase family protein [Coriobacteriales bacterium]
MGWRITALIPAAGLSERMGDFKPLMELDDQAMIARTLHSALAGGADDALVVLGNNGAAIRELLRGQCRFITNQAYRDSDMFSSVQLGLQTLLDSEWPDEPLDGVFILPGDIPAVSPQTFQSLVAAAEEAAVAAATAAAVGAEVAAAVVVPAADSATTPVAFVPTCNGRHGHPLLLLKPAFSTILRFQGQDGLRQILKNLKATEVEVDDPAIILDADTPEGFKDLEFYLKGLK